MSLLVANALFPNIEHTPEYYEEKYPKRNIKEGARVTRFAPSPTGFLHLGSLYSAFIDKVIADSTGGIYYLRIEDTDKKREVENGVSLILDGLYAFGVVPNEGVTGENTYKGDYGPYCQSERGEIYRTYAKELVEKGLVYPCFCTPEELDDLRETQEQKGETPGYYGEFAKCRNLSEEEQIAKIKEGKPFVLRIKSDSKSDKKIIVDDLIRGRLELPVNTLDAVILKSDGIPPYAFAHAVDDHLMRTTHVVRGDEWIATLPLHIQIFATLGFKPPKYVHISPIMKMDGDSKRKLSKRKDPEAAVDYYKSEGFPAVSVREYLLTLANSNFEDWRRQNPKASQSEFPFNIKKMSGSGALFDLMKLEDVSKNVISVMTADEVYGGAVDWAKEYDTELYSLLSENPDYAKAVFSIDRDCKKPRKDIRKWSDVKEYVEYFYDELYKPVYNLPDNISKEDAKDLLTAYLSVYDESDDKELWFSKIKQLCEPFGFTPNVKEYKKNPDAFKGHVGDVSSLIRLAVTSRINTPDLCLIMKLLGEKTVNKRINDFLEAI
ncbi:MAG TPA: glutamate--tRNA ligase [Clostridia bacterium]|nr:glutamate--tRNA ligase [Clostridia bacterium]